MVVSDGILVSPASNSCYLRLPETNGLRIFLGVIMDIMVWDRPKWCLAGCKSFKDVEGAGGIGGGVERHVVMVQERVIWHKHIPKLDELPQHLGCIQVAQEPGLGQIFAVMYLHELNS